MSSQSVTLKRQVTIKTIVTDTFRERAQGELSAEVKQIDSQLVQLEAQYQETLKRLEEISNQGQNVRNQLEQLNQEAQAKRNQLTNLKLDVSKQLNNLNNVENGAHVVTGMLESFVDVKVGENIYDRVRGTTVIIKDGVVEEIIG